VVSPNDPAAQAHETMAFEDEPAELDHNLLLKIATGISSQANRDHLSIKVTESDFEAKRAEKERDKAALILRELAHEEQIGATSKVSTSPAELTVRSGGDENDGAARTLPRVPKRATLVSANRPVTASAAGNLGPPSVVTSEAMSDWLTDRWQAASDMSGSPIPGSQWLEVDLGRTCVAERFVIDWETAFANVSGARSDFKVHVS
jgi:hypothetical protein